MKNFNNLNLRREKRSHDQSTNFHEWTNEKRQGIPFFVVLVNQKSKICHVIAFYPGHSELENAKLLQEAFW